MATAVLYLRGGMQVFVKSAHQPLHVDFALLQQALAPPPTARRSRRRRRRGAATGSAGSPCASNGSSAPSSAASDRAGGFSDGSGAVEPASHPQHAWRLASSRPAGQPEFEPTHSHGMEEEEGFTNHTGYGGGGEGLDARYALHAKAGRPHGVAGVAEKRSEARAEVAQSCTWEDPVQGAREPGAALPSTPRRRAGAAASGSAKAGFRGAGALSAKVAEPAGVAPPAPTSREECVRSAFKGRDEQWDEEWDEQWDEEVFSSSSPGVQNRVLVEIKPPVGEADHAGCNGHGNGCHLDSSHFVSPALLAEVDRLLAQPDPWPSTLESKGA